MGTLPRQARGRKIFCDICGTEGFERDSFFSKQEGKLKCKFCVETLTEKQRQQSIKG